MRRYALHKVPCFEAKQRLDKVPGSTDLTAPELRSLHGRSAAARGLLGPLLSHGQQERRQRTNDEALLACGGADFEFRA